MLRVRPCIACGAPLKNDECSTPNCIYNPESDTKDHDAEFEYVEGVGENPTDEESFDFGGHEISDEEMAELLDDREDIDHEGQHEGESEQKQRDPEAEQKDASDEADTLDISQEDLPDPGAPPEDEDAPPEDDYGDLPDDELSQEETDELANEGKGEVPEEEGTGDLDEMTDEQKDLLNQEREKQLSKDEDGPEPGDDVHDLPEDQGDEDDGLPPRPRGCNGDCKPSDDPGSEDGEPCPHCTAKQFREEMQEQGKENLPEEQMEAEWQDFLDNWQDETEGSGGDQGDADTEGIEQKPEMEEILDQMAEDDEQLSQEGEGGQGDPDDAPEDWEPNLDDDDLPPRPMGCSGNCAENDDPNNDGDPCPHCTAKAFKEGMREELEEREENFDPEELAERFQQMLQERREKIAERQEQDRNVDDLLDEDDPEPEPEDSERDQLIERVNEARDNFDIGVFEDLAAMSDEKLTGMFSAEELSDFGDVAENNNAHTEAERLRDLAEKMNTPPEDELQDDAEDESEDDREQNKHEEKLEQEEKQEEQEEGFKRKGKDLTITQEKRFDNIVNRIAKKVEGTFGQTAEEMFTMPKSDGQFQGEDLSQAIQITSRGVIYWVTISAAKDIDLS